ncbi:MAG: hypothetical protein ACRDAO_05910 [Culicoidibacterales bacterium]
MMSEGYHIYNMILNGIAIEGESPYYNDLKNKKKRDISALTLQ